MISSNIAKRYARAFFKIAAEEERYEDYAQELGLFSTLLKESKNLGEFLANPVFSQPDKKKVVETLLARLDVSPLTANFLKLLVDKRRIGILSDNGGNDEDYLKSIGQGRGNFEPVSDVGSFGFLFDTEGADVYSQGGKNNSLIYKTQWGILVDTN